MSTEIYLLSEGRGEVFTPKITFRNNQIIRYDVDCLMECDCFNRNERNYKWELVTNALNHSFIKERLATSTWYCEAGHPREKSIERQTSIDRLNSTCILKSINASKRPVISGEVETMATSLGRDLRDLILYNGAVVAHSMRSLGKLKKASGNSGRGFDVVPPLFITNWDEVVHPSVSKAYINSTIKRSEDGKIKNKLNPVSGSDKSSVVALEEGMLTQFLTQNVSQSKDVIDWLGESLKDVTSSYNPKTGVATIQLLNESNAIIIPTRGELRNSMNNFLSNL